MMGRYARWQVQGHIASALEAFLADQGMKRGFIFRRTFSKQGVSVNYTYDCPGPSCCPTFGLEELTTEIYLKAKTAAQATDIYKTLTEFFAENCRESHCKEKTELFSSA